MDHKLMLRISPPAAGVRGRPWKETRATIGVVDDATGEIEVTGPGGTGRYTLKPLGELYGAGPGAATVDPEDDRFMPLFLAIEEEITRYYETVDSSLTDGHVLLALKNLGMNPEAPASDPLARRVQLALRMTLSLNDYSRQDVRSALRQIAKSVERHTRADGRRGYLDFLRTFFGRRR